MGSIQDTRASNQYRLTEFLPYKIYGGRVVNLFNSSALLLQLRGNSIREFQAFCWHHFWRDGANIIIILSAWLWLTTRFDNYGRAPVLIDLGVPYVGFGYQLDRSSVSSTNRQREPRGLADIVSCKQILCCPVVIHFVDDQGWINNKGLGHGSTGPFLPLLPGVSGSVSVGFSLEAQA